MNYILRFVVHEACWQRQLDELTQLCRKAPITEVMLMEQSHQILTCAFLREKHVRMAAIYREFAAALARLGVGYSINLATTVGHGDNTVDAQYLLPFQRFVGESLTESHAVYCIADAGWADYTAEIAALYAATNPLRLMIDDDFRSLNHSAAMGCFCPLHAQLTGEKLGISLTGKQLADALCGCNEDSRRIRQAWMQVNFEVQLRAAQKIEAAVHAVSPDVQIGLMNSGEPSHSVQGREMPRLLAAFAGEGRQKLSRPAGWAYADGLHGDVVMMHQMTALSMQAAGDHVDWVSEVENYPHTLYTKSLRLTRLQMQLHALCGVNALSLNLYDYLATPLPLQPEISALLQETAARTDAIAHLRCGKQLQGVGLLWHKDAAAHQINRAGCLSALMPGRPLDSILPQLGIAVRFDEGDVNALLGDLPLCYSREQLVHLLGKGLLLDAVAAAHLEEMGLGEYLGVRCGAQVNGPCVEQLTNPLYCGAFTGALLCTNWNDIVKQGGWIARLQPAAGTQVISTLATDEWQTLSPAMTLFENALGGRVCVLALPVQELGWLTAARAMVMRHVCKALAGKAFLPIVNAHANVAPFYYENPDDGTGLLALVNCGLDEEATELPEGLRCTPLFEPAQGTALAPLAIQYYKTERML